MQGGARHQGLLRVQRRDDGVDVRNYGHGRRDVDEGDHREAGGNPFTRHGRHRQVYLQLPRGLEQGRGRFERGCHQNGQWVFVAFLWLINLSLQRDMHIENQSYWVQL